MGPLTLTMRMIREEIVHSILGVIVGLREDCIWITCWADGAEAIIAICKFQ